MPKVLISDALSPRAAEIFAARGIEVDFAPGLGPEELKARIGGYDGLAVRSATKVTAGLLSRAPQSSRSSAGPASASTTSTSQRRRSAALS